MKTSEYMYIVLPTSLINLIHIINKFIYLLYFTAHLSYKVSLQKESEKDIYKVSI